MPDQTANPATPNPTAEQPAASGPTFRAFTRDDWAGFAGAEHFTDGAQPIATEGSFTLGAKRAWLAILDGTGGCLLVDGDVQNDYGGYCLHRPFATPAEAQAWFAKEVANPAHLLDFLMAGFQRV